MLRGNLAILLTAAIGLFAADDPAWKTKQISEWTTEDAHQVLSDSPWAKGVIPTVNPPSNQGGGNPGGRRRGGIGIGFPGGGIGRPYPGGGYPGGGSRRIPSGAGQDDTTQTPQLTIRWESALPVREAELKARDTHAPTIDQGVYAIAVYGVPSRMANPDSKTLPDQLKKGATLKRDGKKDLKPSKVEVLQRDNGPVILYLFQVPKSRAITQQDRRVEFAAKAGRLEFSQAFFLDDMVYQGKLAL